MSQSLLHELADELQASPEEVRRALRQLRQRIVQDAQSDDRVPLDGLGEFYRDDGTVAFQPDEMFARFINRRFAGTEPITLSGVDLDIPDDYTTEEAEDDWTEPLEPKPADHLGVPDPYEEADFDVIDEIEEEVAAEQNQSSVRSATESTSTDVSPHAASSEDEENVAHPVDFWWPASRPKDFGVRRRDPLLESSFVGTTLVAADKGEKPHVTAEPTPSNTEEHTGAGKRPRPSRERSDAGRAWKKGAVAAVVLLLLGTGAWFIAERTDTGDDIADAAPETEETVSPDDDDAPSAEEEESPPLADAEEPFPTEPEPETDDAAPEPIEPVPGQWTIVVASETSREAAEQEVDALWPSLEDEQLPMDIFPTDINGTTRYRVAVGSFDSQEEATAHLNSLSEQLPEGAWLLQFE